MTERANKVATVTLAFWVMKICATTVGETGGDMLSMTLGLGYAASTVLLLGLFIAALVAQLRAKTFHPALYWAVILATSTAGTTLSDFMDRSLGLGYAQGAAILATILVGILLVWRFGLGSVSVSRIEDRKVELLYWAAILTSNTLGTALGDFLSDSSGLGFAMSNLLIGGAILGTAIVYRFRPRFETALFWIAFVLTRPFGATMGDLLTKNPVQGGLGFGTIGASSILLAVLSVFLMRECGRGRAAVQSAGACPSSLPPSSIS